MRCRLPNVCSYRYNWKEDEARKQILRTHTTAVSARMLYEIANVSVCVGVCVCVAERVGGVTARLVAGVWEPSSNRVASSL